VSAELRPAAAFGGATRAALFEAGYAGYVVPVHMDAATLETITAAWDVDLDRSRVALRDGVPVGFVYLGVRGDRSWIGGLGVVESERRRGTGRALMEAALAEAPGDVLLEVIDSNEPAIRLYEELGFERVRRLDVWSLTAEVPASTATPAEPRLVEEDAPWQRARPSLEGAAAFEVDGGAVVFRPGERVNVLQLSARDETAARELLAAAKGDAPSLHYVNVPSDAPAVAALRALGGSLDLRQLELRLRRV
jgi:ribosomal protein S18 acetylase RimI-like enzyme